ncbi:MAG: glycerol-3-phosphate 1-O-acyltransferase PlsY [Patescibacteria group bacterium]
MQSFILAGFGYLLGSIPFGYIISKYKHIDIRKIGSGNIGGTNVSRALGIKWGLVSGFLDFTKGVIPSLLAVLLIQDPWHRVFVFLMPTIGHIFPVWLGFKGGKGVSTLMGALLIIVGWQFLMIWIGVWLVILKITKIMSLVNIFMVLAIPVILWLMFDQTAYVFFGVVSIVLIWYAHRENIGRLIKGKELKLKI